MRSIKCLSAPVQTCVTDRKDPANNSFELSPVHRGLLSFPELHTFSGWNAGNAEQTRSDDRYQRLETLLSAIRKRGGSVVRVGACSTRFGSCQKEILFREYEFYGFPQAYVTLFTWSFSTWIYAYIQWKRTHGNVKSKRQNTKMLTNSGARLRRLMIGVIICSL